jgi:hypothetical protein
MAARCAISLMPARLPVSRAAPRGKTSLAHARRPRAHAPTITSVPSKAHAQELNMDKPVILNTGAPTGIGRATAVALAKKGDDGLTANGR